MRRSPSLQETKPWSIHFEAANKSSSRTFHLRAKYLSHLRFEPPFVAPNNASYCARRFREWRDAFLPLYLEAVRTGALPEEPGHQCVLRWPRSLCGRASRLQPVHALADSEDDSPKPRPTAAASCRYYDEAAFSFLQDSGFRETGWLAGCQSCGGECKIARNAR